MEVTIKSKPIRTQILWKYTDDDRAYIIFKPNSFSLNDTGTFIWENANGDLSVEELTDMICKEFDTGEESEVVLEETMLFVETLMKADLLYLDEFEEESYD